MAEDCLGENNLPWWYDLERGLEKNVKTRYLYRDDSPEGHYVVLLKGSFEGIPVWMVEDVDPGFKTSDEEWVQSIVDNYLKQKNEEELDELYKQRILEKSLG